MKVMTCKAAFSPFMKQLRQKRPDISVIINIGGTVLSAFFQVLFLQVFMEPCGLLPAGFTGMAILIHKISALFQVNISTSLGIVLLNIPAILLCYKYVSKKFTLLSCIQIIFVSIFMEIFHFTPLFTDTILNVLLGGCLWGLSITLALRSGSSSGGTDFIAQFISSKTHKGSWQYIFLFNCLLLLIFGSIFGWKHAGYSIVFQFLSTKTISSFYQQYSQVTLEMTTRYPKEVSDAFMKSCRHGMSIISGYGGYRHQQIFLCKSVISTYETEKVIKAVKTADPEIIINSYKTENFYGNFFYQKI